MIVYGSRASTMSQVIHENLPCNHCETRDQHRMTIFGKYAHIFWIPLFPIGRAAVDECGNCKRTIEKSEFNTAILEAHKQQLAETKRPIWHWIGLILVGGFFLLSTIIGGIAAATYEPEPREILLNEQIDLLTKTPDETDTLTTKLQSFLNIMVVEEMKPQNFKYRIALDDYKALILVKIPRLNMLDEAVYPELLETVETVLTSQKDLETKDLYIGIRGRSSMEMAKTPADTRYGNGCERLLYEFFGVEEQTVPVE